MGQVQVGGTSKSHRKAVSKRRYKSFPYEKVAQMWGAGKSIAQIGHSIKRVDKDSPTGDLYHSLRNFLYRMHSRGYKNKSGRLVRLPYRVSVRTVRAARKAGLRAW
jgi:hypothetical protein